MSKSYKHIPVCKDRHPEYKKIFNRRIRRAFKGDMPNGGYYKKLNCSYEISDFSTLVFWEEYLDRNTKEGLSEEEILEDYNDWAKWYYRK